MALTSAIPKIWKDKIAHEMLLHKFMDLINANDIYIIINSMAKDIKTINSKQIYQKLIADKICPPTSINKWCEMYPFMEACDWKVIFQLPYKIVKEPFLQSFQYKVLNRIVNCNDKLFTWKIKTSNTCEYCQEIDTLRTSSVLV